MAIRSSEYEPKGSRLNQAANRFSFNLKRTLMAGMALEAMQNTLRETIAAAGFSHFAYLSIRHVAGANATAHTFGTYPESWCRRYVENRFLLYDPVLRECMNRIVPLRWSEVSHLRPLSLEQESVMREARAYKLANGLSIPLHHCGGGLAILSATVESDDESSDEFLENRKHFLHAIALIYHDAVRSSVEAGRVALPVSPVPGGQLAELMLQTGRRSLDWEGARRLN